MKIIQFVYINVILLVISGCAIIAAEQPVDYGQSTTKICVPQCDGTCKMFVPGPNEIIIINPEDINPDKSIQVPGTNFKIPYIPKEK